MAAKSSYGRREMLRMLGALGTAAALPAGGLGCKSSSSSSSPGYFTDQERRALGALADAVLPPDDTPGGSALGAVDYIERLLTALDGIDAGATPTLFAGGPFSGRTPFGDDHGNASTSFPPNDFASWLDVDRVTLASWRLALYGSAGVGGGPNDGITGPVVGLRDQVKNGLADALGGAPTPLDQLSPGDLAQAFANLEKSFQALLIELVSEAAWSAPEYGGNANLAGWQMIHFQGDVQPLGYSVWDAGAMTMKERADAPVTVADPGPDPDPMDGDVRMLVTNITMFTNGTVFP